MIHVYSAAGNIIGLLSSTNPLPSDLNILDQHKIDQLIVYHPKTFALIIYNRDGSRALQCGNGLRALGFHLKHDLIASISNIDFSITYSPEAVWANLALPSSITALSHQGISLYEVHIGNPHLIVFSMPDEAIISTYHTQYNISFVSPKEDSFDIKTYERGVGFTQSCGSASCAAVSILYQSVKKDTWKANTQGGQLLIHIKEDGYWLSGPITPLQSLLL